MNWANRLTIFRIILVPVFITAVLYQRLEVALLVFLAASITDCLDGYIARTKNEVTSLGTMLDPLADKLLINSAFICFSMVSGIPVYLKMPVYVPMIVISRDVLLLIGAVIMYMHSEKIEIKPTIIGKVTTVFQMLTIIMLLLKFVYSSWLWNATCVLTVASGLDYLRIGSRKLHEKKQ